MNTTENNKLIAEFMGYSKSTINDDKFAEKLAFNLDWNWLMEVVEKIKPFLHNSFESRSEAKKVLHSLDHVDIKHTQNAVVDFIKWYNSSKK